MKKRIFPIILVLCIVISTYPMVAFADNIVEVTTFEQLKNALNQEVAGETIDNPTIIVLKSDIVVTSEMQVYGNKFKTLVADADRTISREQGIVDDPVVHGFGFHMLKVEGGSTFNLGGISTYTGVITFEGANPGAKNWDWTAQGVTDSIINVTGGSIFNMYSGILTKNNTGGGVGALRIWGATANLYGGTICQNTTTGDWTVGPAIYMNELSNLLIDGANIVDNKSAERGGAIMCEKSAVVFESGLIKGNGGSTIIDITGESDKPGSFIMNGGTIEGIGALYSDNDRFFEFRNISSGTFNGGIIKNTKSTAMLFTNSTTSATFNAGESGKGILMQNCGYDGTNVTAYDGGCIRNPSGTITINAGTFKDCRCVYGGGLIQSNGTVNLLGGYISGCDSAIRHNGGTFNMGGSVWIAPTDRIFLNASTATINIVSNFTTVGAVGIFSHENGRQVLSGDAALVAANANKFAASPWNDYFIGVNSSGIVDNTIAAPTFIDPNETPAEPTVSIADGSVTVSNAPSSCILIIASYNGTKLVDAKVINNATGSYTIANEISTVDSTSVKAFLWDNITNIKPLCDSAS